MTAQAVGITGVKSLVYNYLGLADYRSVWEEQKILQRKLIEKQIGDHFLVCQHKPVITLGRSTKPGNIKVSEEILIQHGVEAIEIERGGDVTYHGPGQIVGYPIIDLNNHKRDVAWYMRTLEEVIIQFLSDYGINGERIDGKTGVWIQSSNRQDPKKIASIGVRISRWCTMHGFSINIKDCSLGFSFINPCGYKDIEITSLEHEKKIKFDVDELSDNIVMKFGEVFGYNVK